MELDPDSAGGQNDLASDPAHGKGLDKTIVHLRESFGALTGFPELPL
jgi:hypothetical protein